MLDNQEEKEDLSGKLQESFNSLYEKLSSLYDKAESPYLPTELPTTMENFIHSIKYIQDEVGVATFKRTFLMEFKKEEENLQQVFPPLKTAEAEKIIEQIRELFLAAIKELEDKYPTSRT